MSHPLNSPTNRPQKNPTFAQSLGDLTAEVVTKAKESLKGALETAKALLSKLNPFQNELTEGKDIEKKNKGELVATVAPILLYLFGFKAPETKKGSAEATAEETIQIPEIPAIPEKKEDLKTFFIQSLAQKESSAKPGEAPTDEKNQVRPYFHYANFDTIPAMSAKYKLGPKELFKNGLPANLQEFRQILVNNKPPIAIKVIDAKKTDVEVVEVEQTALLLIRVYAAKNMMISNITITIFGFIKIRF